MNLSDEVLALEEEARQGACKGDTLSFFFNKAGYERFKHKLPHGENEAAIPVYAIDITQIHYGQFVKNLQMLLPMIKGYALRISAPQKRRRLVHFLNNAVLNYIRHPELDNSNSVISELTANAEKSNFEAIFRDEYPDSDIPVDVYIRDKRDVLIQDAIRANRHVQIIWKFSPQIYKVEVKNNTLIPEYTLNTIRNKMTNQLSHLAEGFTGEVFDKLGAGLGLYFINFFSTEMKERFGFETIFRIFTTAENTSATLTVFFEKIAI